MLFDARGKLDGYRYKSSSELSHRFGSNPLLGGALNGGECITKSVLPRMNSPCTAIDSGTTLVKATFDEMDASLSSNNHGEDDVSKQYYLAAVRPLVRILVVVAFATATGNAFAQDGALKNAIQCKDFKHSADGSWFAEDVSLNYGGGNNQQQLNLFGPTKIRKGKNIDGIDLWSLLNERCGTSH
jgi:hypothetical protein